MLDIYYETDLGRLYQTDCLDLLSSLETESIDTIFVDPPFNIGKDYKSGFQDDIEESVYWKWCFQWIKEGVRVLHNGGAFFIYSTPKLAVRFSSFLEDHNLSFRHWIAMTMKGTYPRGNRLYPAHYALLYYTKGEPKTFHKLRTPIEVCRHCNGEIKDYGGHRSKMHPDGVSLTDFWTDTSPNRHKKYKIRPGVNELKLIIPERAILMSTNKNNVVLDFFAGGGSTLQAAELHGRNWVGGERYDVHHAKLRLIGLIDGSIDQHQ